MRKARSSASLSAMVAAAIMERPSSLSDLCVMCGIDPHQTDRVKRFVQAYEDEGVVYVSGYKAGRHPIYAWQPSPSRYVNATRPQGANHASN